MRRVWIVVVAVLSGVVGLAPVAGATTGDSPTGTTCSVERVRQGRFMGRITSDGEHLISVRRQPNATGSLFTRFKMGPVVSVSFEDGALPDGIEAVRYVLDVRTRTGRLVERVPCRLAPIAEELSCSVVVDRQGEWRAAVTAGVHGVGYRTQIERTVPGFERFVSGEGFEPEYERTGSDMAQLQTEFSVRLERHFRLLDRVVCSVSVEPTPSCVVAVDESSREFVVSVDGDGVEAPEFRLLRRVEEGGPRWFRATAAGDVGEVRDPIPTHIGLTEVRYEMIVRSLLDAPRPRYITEVTCGGAG